MIIAPDIPGHRVTGVLGTGGFATVYRCWQLAVGREVAVKIDNRVLLTERDQRRFMREVTAAGRLSGHPHVIDVYDAGTLVDGRPYLVMELCPGGSLNDLLRKHGPASPARVRDIGVKLSDALAAAHAAGVLHRDIKPGNILVNRYGVVGLSDFGLASIIAASGEQSVSRDALTPAYAPPESFRGVEPTVSADVYSLTATLYALLAGRPPRFPAGTGSPGIATIVNLHGTPVEDIPGVPADLMAVLRWGLAPDPGQRPQGAVALRDALAALALAPPPAGAPAATGPEVSLVSPVITTVPGGGHGGGLRLPTDPMGPPAPAGQAAPPATQPGTRRRALPAGASAAGLAVVVVVAALAGARFFAHSGAAAHGTSSGRPPTGAAQAAPPGVFGVPTVTKGCPAATVATAAARCTKTPECWNGLVVISGSATAEPLSCTGPHVWETFAIAILPTAVRTYSQNLVEANGTVRAVCSVPVLLRSRLGPARRIPAKGWDVEVLPPSQVAFDSGERAYRCVAHVLNGPNPKISQFTR